MATETSVVLNQNTTNGAAVATVLDASARAHQEVIVQTQSGSSDPVSVSSANPLPVGGNVADGSSDSGSAVKVAGVYNSTPPTVGNGQRYSLQVDANGFLKVNIAAGAAAGGTSSTLGSAIPATATAAGYSDGTNLQLAKVDGSGNLKVNLSAGATPGGQDNTSFTAGTTQGMPILAVADNTNAVAAVTQGNEGILKMSLGRAMYVAPQANVVGGWTPLTVLTTASTNSSVVKASAGSIGQIVAVNTSATIGYLKIFNKASAATLGTDTPVWNVPIPANTNGAGISIPIPAGISFSTGIAIAVTGAIALLDATNGPAGIALNLGYA